MSLEVGTRVEKINARLDDAHPNGDRGQVAGAWGGYCAVQWDTMPGMHNLIRSSCLRVLEDQTMPVQSQQIGA